MAISDNVPSVGMAVPRTTELETPKRETALRRLPALDGLRALSIFVVMLSHAGLGTIVPGGLGVTIFFFISGLLITRLLLDEVDRGGEIRLGEFYIRRFLRLQPALLVYVAVACTTLALMGTRPYWKDILAVVFYAGNYYEIFHGEFLHPVAFTPNGLQQPIQTPFGIVWSLAIEEHFYLFFPVVVALLAGVRARLFAVLTAICILDLVWRVYLVKHGAHTVRTYMGSDTRIDSIIYGALLAVAMSMPAARAWVRKVLGSRMALVLGLALLLGTLVVRSASFRETLRYSLQGIALAPIVYGIVFDRQNRFLNDMFSHPGVVYVGKLSYSLYLYHYAAFMVGTWFVVTYGFVENGVVWTVVSVTLTLLGAAGSYHLVEKKFFDLRRRFGSAV